MPSRQTPRQTRRRRVEAAPAPAPVSDSDLSSDDEVTFKTAEVAASADDSVATQPIDLQDDVSTLAGSDDEAPASVGLADAREEAEALLRDLAASRQRRDDSRRQRDQERQQRNREQKLDKQRRLEMELSQELMDELAAELAEEEQGSAGGKKSDGSTGAAGKATKAKKKRFKYPTPAASGALDFIPLTEGESTEFKAAALPASALPAVVNPELVGLRERLLYSGRIPRRSAKGLKQIQHKQAASGKYGRR